MTTTIDHDAELTRTLHEQMPLSRHNQITGVSADTNSVVMHAPWQPQFCGIGGGCSTAAT